MVYKMQCCLKFKYIKKMFINFKRSCEIYKKCRLNLTKVIIYFGLVAG